MDASFFKIQNPYIYILSIMVMAFVILVNIKYRDKPYSLFTKKKIKDEMARSNQYFIARYTYVYAINLLILYIMTSPLLSDASYMLLKKIDWVEGKDQHLLFIINLIISISFTLLVVNHYHKILFFKQDALVACSLFKRKRLIVYDNKLKIYCFSDNLPIFYYYANRIFFVKSKRIISYGGITNLRQLIEFISDKVYIKNFK